MNPQEELTEDDGEPITQEHKNQLGKFERYLNNFIGQLFAKYATRAMYVLMGSGVAGGGWLTKVQMDISETAKAVARIEVESKERETSLRIEVKEGIVILKNEADVTRKLIEQSGNATTARIIDWSQWRVKMDWTVDSYQARLTWLEGIERERMKQHP